MNIWWIPAGKSLAQAEKIDECALRDASALAAEYRMAYGGVVWAGRKADCPMLPAHPLAF